jgi:DNA-binding LacI/PurR family transcriptional regulator
VVFVLCATDQGGDRFAEPFQSGLFYYLERCCADVGYHLIYKTATARDHIADIIGGIDVSYLVFSSYVFGHYLTEAEELGIPLLFANHRHPEYTSVESDDLNASRKLIDYFIEQGHRRIAVITGPQDYCTSRDRLAGWEAALRNHAIPCEGMPVFEGDWSFNSGYEAGKKIAALPKPDWPDGIFAFNDEMALGVIRALQEEGVSIPREISVAGYDDIAVCTKVIPTLTTVHVDIAAMAAAIIQQLYFNLREGGRAPVIQIRVPTCLVIRDSVADRRGACPREVQIAKESAR